MLMFEIRNLYKKADAKGSTQRFLINLKAVLKLFEKQGSGIYLASFSCASVVDAFLKLAGYSAVTPTSVWIETTELR